MERNNRKEYIDIDRETGSNEIYAMRDEIESDTESDIENLLKILIQGTYQKSQFQTIRKKAITF